MFATIGLVLALAQAGKAPAPNLTAPPPKGVYMYFGPGTIIFPSFGLVDGTTYVDGDNKRGRYTFTGDLLTMTTGGLEGTKYKRTHEREFRLLRANGDLTGYSCVLEPKKSVTNPKGW